MNAAARQAVRPLGRLHSLLGFKTLPELTRSSTRTPASHSAWGKPHIPRPNNLQSRQLSQSRSAQSLPEFSLQDHVIAITGGARGLGLTQARAVLECGGIVHAIDRLETPDPTFPKLEKEFPGRLTFHTCDVTSQSDIHSLISRIARSHGRLDGAICAAGIQQETPALDYKEEDIDRMLAVNVKGVFLTAQAVAKSIRDLPDQEGGSIVLIASMSGTVANRGLICPLYNASKAAVVQLARNLASEWSAPPLNIRVNSISPGYIVTDMTESLFEKFPKRRKTWAGDNMMDRLSTPAEFRGPAVFLLSKASSYMTGSDMIIDGGHTAW